MILLESSKGSICILPRLEGMGGPVSFQGRLIAGLQQRGYAVHHNPQRPDTAAILVMGGTNRLMELWRAHKRGVRIVQRLNGMNWLHRRIPASLGYRLRAERSNWLLAFIRRRLADRIVYQSHFAQGWWQRVWGADAVATRVIYNGVDLNVFSPEGAHQRPDDRLRLLLVEGRLRDGYEHGLKNAIHLVEGLEPIDGRPLELAVVGEVSASLRAYWQEAARTPICWMGVIPQAEIPQVDRSAHVLFSADLNAACPNSVVEALACGLPVISFDTGALPEMVSGDAGRVVPYGADPWKLESPDILALTGAAREVLADQERFRRGARARAEEAFSLEKMVAEYIEMLL
ncbi:MAG: glycosyltransferase family 4 protein [Chloroflexi bacterium]|nr:glycosyltransferase family 4 protein [Chloroflexota bacterium]